MADEKVLDVTAIDMTDAALAKRKPTKRAARTTSKRMARSAGPPSRRSTS